MPDNKLGIPKGTRDFSPAELFRRNYIFDTIKSVYQRYGYQPIETPAMENLSTLMGKYGEEGDKLLFRILNSGDFVKNLLPCDIAENKLNKISNAITEKGLRFDLTVPFARYVVQHRNEITFPFKRYQIQAVWRADKPQRGRYREFFQCDADVIGSNSLLNEVELILIIDDVFDKLGIKTTVKINHRKILTGIAELIGEPDKITDITVAIDKLDKIGSEKVNEELARKGLSSEAIQKLQPIIISGGKQGKKYTQLMEVLKDSPAGLKGIGEITAIMQHIQDHGLKAKLEYDITLARGLDYYTGTIIEVKANHVKMGSLCGGGRYDDLTGIFGLPDISGVGISFGADRIYDVMQELNLFPGDIKSSTRVMLVNFGHAEARFCLSLLSKIRKKGINAELYPEAAKMKKQLSYADSKKIPFVLLIGSEEMKSGKFTLKNMHSGAQENLSLEEIIRRLEK